MKVLPACHVLQQNYFRFEWDSAKVFIPCDGSLIFYLWRSSKRGYVDFPHRHNYGRPLAMLKRVELWTIPLVRPRFSPLHPNNPSDPCTTVGNQLPPCIPETRLFVRPQDSTHQFKDRLITAKMWHPPQPLSSITLPTVRNPFHRAHNNSMSPRRKHNYTVFGSSLLIPFTLTVRLLGNSSSPTVTISHTQPGVHI